jgi:hypothetical protein
VDVAAATWPSRAATTETPGSGVPALVTRPMRVQAEGATALWLPGPARRTAPARSIALINEIAIRTQSCRVSRHDDHTRVAAG